MRSAWTPFRLSQHKELLIPAAYVIGAFIIGLIGGASVLHTLNQAQLEELRQYLDGFLNGAGTLAQNSQISSIRAWGEVLKGQLYSMGIMWLLGLSVIGAPLIILLEGARGFILGFTIGFLIKEKAGQGLLLAMVAVLPQNLCYMPGLLGAGTLALYFTASLFKSSRNTPVFTGMLVYTLIFIALSLLILIGSWIEVCLVPGLMRLTMSL